MIIARFCGDKPTGFCVSGHSGLAPAGEDIVCAAVTSAVRLTEVLINDILKVQAVVSVVEESATITLRLPHQSPPEAIHAMVALKSYLKQLASEYPEHISVRRCKGRR